MKDFEEKLVQNLDALGGRVDVWGAISGDVKGRNIAGRQPSGDAMSRPYVLPEENTEKKPARRVNVIAVTAAAVTAIAVGLFGMLSLYGGSFTPAPAAMGDGVSSASNPELLSTADEALTSAADNEITLTEIMTSNPSSYTKGYLTSQSVSPSRGDIDDWPQRTADVDYESYEAHGFTPAFLWFSDDRYACTMRIINYSTKTITFGTFFKMYRETADGAWQECALKDNTFFPEIAYAVEPYDEVTQSTGDCLYDLSVYQDITPGTRYRITVDIWIDGETVTAIGVVRI